MPWFLPANCGRVHTQTSVKTTSLSVSQIDGAVASLIPPPQTCPLPLPLLSGYLPPPDKRQTLLLANALPTPLLNLLPRLTREGVATLHMCLCVYVCVCCVLCVLCGYCFVCMCVPGQTSTLGNGRAWPTPPPLETWPASPYGFAGDTEVLRTSADEPAGADLSCLSDCIEPNGSGVMGVIIGLMHVKAWQLAPVGGGAFGHTPPGKLDGSEPWLQTQS